MTNSKMQNACSLNNQELDNLAAFTRLLGYVRYFHPSDRAVTTNWEQFAISNINQVETAEDSKALVAKLRKIFTPIAPTVLIFANEESSSISTKLQRANSQDSLRLVTWEHYGVQNDLDAENSLYYSKRVYHQATEELITDYQPYQANLEGGVSCVIPLALWVKDDYPSGTLRDRTLPHTQEIKATEAIDYSLEDRATRIAAIILAWNVWQHFYPYFDVVAVDWLEALKTALKSAATDKNTVEFDRTLRRLVAKLEDGHGIVHAPNREGNNFIPPFIWDWIEDSFVITHVLPDSDINLEPGDIVLTIDGRSAAEVISDRDVLLEVHSDTQTRTVELSRTLQSWDRKEPLPDKIEQLQSGIVYLDSERVDDLEFQQALPLLETATGIIIDLRGYPRISTDFIGHLIDKPVTCARWHIPQAKYPDCDRLDFDFSNWSIEPRQPRLKAKVVVMTNGSAISYAETCLGIIEHYQLAEIVGQPTAGTNGNINEVMLPGNYKIWWTGMKVLKHDGSRHHGVGILPTIPVERTIQGVAQGRDEFLERAIEIVSC